MKLITLVLATMLLCGCTNKPAAKIEISSNSVSEELESPVDQPETRLDEDAILKIAKKAVQENDTWAERAEYTATKEGSE